MLRRLARSDAGAAAVEFAAVVGPLILLIIGVFEYGRLLWTREALQETAMAGARCMGMTYSSCATGGAYSATDTDTFIEGQATNWGVTLAASNISLSSSGTCAGVTSANAFATVTITYTFQSVLPPAMLGFSGAPSLSSTACFPNN
ncbi:MAG TPA: TadE/TadG family type IV pilus assembly protein [Caulobacteraceae bacterium]|nr:TadE/TadG family type IV pilus assembly protein [Caulobacteraceae bacterium]